MGVELNVKLKEKIRESLSALLPITGIVLMLSIFLIPMELGSVVMFLTGALMLIVGMGFFQLGAEMAMTPLGEGVTGLLVDEFKSVADYEFTANMEHELDEVEAGKLNYIQLLHNFYDGFEAALKQAEIDLEGKRIKIQDEVTDVICEKCGRNMVIKSGRFGKFLACPGFPECTNTKPITEDTGAACPVCGAKVVKKKSARGYVYYSCDTYPTCQFMTWDKPLKTKCPNCD